MHARFCLPVAVGALVLSMALPGAAFAAGDNPFKVRPAPKILGYDREKDEVVHQDSVMATVRKDRPGGNLSYYGNRMTQFRFKGKSKRAGLYQALDDYKRERKLDPSKYQYRRVF